MSRRSLRVLVVQNEEPTPGGLINEFLAEEGAELEVVRSDLEDRDIDPSEYDLLVPLGSEFAAYEDHRPFVQRSQRLLERALERDVPVLGVCFGGQLLAKVLGGGSFRATDSEIGWIPVRTNDPELVSEGPWFQWHFDSFTTPPGARLVAETDAGPQAFVSGRHLGVQFHPEVTPEIMDGWVRIYRHELDDEGVDPDALLDETNRRAKESRAATRRLLRRFVDDVAGLGSERVRGR